MGVSILTRTDVAQCQLELAHERQQDLSWGKKLLGVGSYLGGCSITPIVLAYKAALSAEACVILACPIALTLSCVSAVIAIVGIAAILRSQQARLRDIFLPIIIGGSLGVGTAFVVVHGISNVVLAILERIGSGLRF